MKAIRLGIAASLFPLLLLGGLAGCGSSSPGTPDAAATNDGSGSLGDAATTTPAATATTGTPAATTSTNTANHSAGNPLSCGQLSSAAVGSASIRLADYNAGAVVLSGGKFTGGDASIVQLQPQCAVGDLNADGVFDALSVVKITFGGTGQFWTLVAWTSNNSGTPQLAASKALGDRNPVTDISIAGNRATVVYLTRTIDVPLAGVNIKRTAIYQLTGGNLVEVSHTDAPYTP